VPRATITRRLRQFGKELGFFLIAHRAKGDWRFWRDILAGEEYSEKTHTPEKAEIYSIDGTIMSEVLNTSTDFVECSYFGTETVEISSVEVEDAFLIVALYVQSGVTETIYELLKDTLPDLELPLQIQAGEWLFVFHGNSVFLLTLGARFLVEPSTWSDEVSA
jgi:hypothetical protein